MWLQCYLYSIAFPAIVHVGENVGCGAALLHPTIGLMHVSSFPVMPITQSDLVGCWLVLSKWNTNSWRAISQVLL